jgi:hypothetical protein
MKRGYAVDEDLNIQQQAHGFICAMSIQPNFYVSKLLVDKSMLFVGKYLS